MEESPTIRATSSEPCSGPGRPNPFDDTDEEQSSRKRQRVSRGRSRSRSADTARGDDSHPHYHPLPEPMSSRDGSNEADPDPSLPSTPARISTELPAEPNSSRVTINLRTNRNLEPIPSSPPSPSPTSPSRMPNGGGQDIARVSVESESDGLSTVPAIETPSSSPSAGGSPRIELVPMDEDEDAYLDPMSTFPYTSDSGTALLALDRISNFFKFQDVDEPGCFSKLGTWIDAYLYAHEGDIGSFYATFEKNREFWRTFPSFIWALSGRTRFFGQFLQDSQPGRQALSELFVSFARLAGRFVEMDVHQLSYYDKAGNPNEPDMGSAEFLIAYAHLLSPDANTAHIGHNIKRHYRWAWDDDVAAMTEAFYVQGGTIPNLTELVEGQLKLITSNPKLIDTLAAPSQIVCKAVVDIVPMLRDADARHAEGHEQLVTEGYEFFKVMSGGLLPIIEKHITCFSVNSALSHMTCLSSLFKYALHYEVGPVRELLEQSRREHPAVARKDFPKVLALEWKFKILHKLITSSQMQLRVTGVSSMQDELLKLHSEYKPANNFPPASPVLLFFANLILDSQLLDYLVGVGSHPELIGDSNNILGFLIVTKTYTPELTDKIWQTVTESQDPRVVEAIVTVLRKILSLLDYPSLLYLCEKLDDIPVESFSNVMRDYCQLLFKCLTDKANQGRLLQLDAQPYELCVRLIRESSMLTAAGAAGFPNILSFASKALRELLNRGPPDEARDNIYLSCITDIASKSQTAPGSIVVVGALLNDHPSDLKKMTVEHGLTKLLVEDLELAIESERQSANLLSGGSAASVARREIIQLIIQNEPGTISADLGSRLWDVLVGSKSIVSNERSISWQLLNTVAKSQGSKNFFIALCFTEFMPTLPPHCFTPGSLDLVGVAISLWFDEVREDFVAEKRAFDSPALEQLWRMILTAPPATIDAAAIKILVDTYVSSPLICKIPRTMARAIHLGLVDRCLKQLKGAASKLQAFGTDVSTGSDERMAVVASDDELQEQELIFARSLAVLREFLRAYQTKPQFAPPKSRLSITTAPTAVEGEPLTVKYQVFDGPKAMDITSITLGKQNTAATLFAGLEKATGFRNYQVYHGGKAVDPEEIDVCRKLEDLNFTGLLLVRKRDDAEGVPDPPNGNKTTLELEITKHFDDLWSYLSMNEKVAQEIYYFLIKFDVYERLLRDFASDMPHPEIFPVGQPFKSLYAVHSLKQYITSKSQMGLVNEAALSRAIALLVAAVADPNVLNQCGTDGLRDVLALHMLDCLLQFLREPVLPTSVTPHLNKSLLDRLLELLYISKNGLVSLTSNQLTVRSFETLLEASIHSTTFWSLFLSHLHENTLLQDVILDDPHPVIRKNAMKQIVNKCTFIPSLAQLSTTQFVIAFWPMVAQLIPKACLRPLQCEETFTLSLTLFKRFADIAIRDLKLEDLVKQWGNLLLSHPCVERIGHPESVDPVAQGLTTMVFYATSFTKASQRTLLCSALGIQLFRQHLFPDLSVEQPDGVVDARIPLLNPTTRRTLADTVYFLVKDDRLQYDVLLDDLRHITPYSAQTDPPYMYDLVPAFERGRSIRSQTGYVGLRNLSNTCYLNSLFTQLFMNVPFREFMLQSHVADAGASQKLLSETQILFSYMQNSYKRFVDPANLAQSIRTYDETPIDIHVQMDVDEFYNLLFDRWESQILASDAKQEFKSFYGGQLVQQVKSKECEHISERMESFSAIQCDIKGKGNLKESLEAYVEGEVMEGDNKYKCSQCDLHVNAVKRACLKDIPDSLIFHLKRFDYNLRTQLRSKINDHFSFPKTIDMTPYKVEYLMNSSEELAEDVFELVGILVHSGTAESGHYYSFIRERPSANDQENWVEFNDESVSPWDPNRMEAACFGGLDYSCQPDSNNNHFEKSYSAYMLFYQRSSVLAAQKQTMMHQRPSSPIRLAAPRLISNHIAHENEIIMRKYCLYDPSHAEFVMKVFSNMKVINGGTCSTWHDLENKVLDVVLRHLDQVFARTKETPDFVRFMLTIRQMCDGCVECSRRYLVWYVEHPESMKQLLLRNPDGLIRHEIALSIINALEKVKNEAPYAYGFGDDDGSTDGHDLHTSKLIQDIVEALTRLWDVFHSNIRAWPEYFGLLASIAQMGKREATLLLDHGFLRKTLEVVCADPLLPTTQQYQRMLSIMAKRVASRPVSYEDIINLLYRLFLVCDVTLEPVEDEDTRLDLSNPDKPVPFTRGEQSFLTSHWIRNHAHILLEKLLLLRQNEETVKEITIRLLAWPDSLDNEILQTILSGLRKGTTSPFCAPFIRAAAVYAERSKNPKAVVSMLSRVTKVAAELDGDNDAALQFFKDVFDGAVGDQDMTTDDFLRFFFDQMNIWGPYLLTDFNSNVRADTEEFIHQALLRHGPDVNFGTEDEDCDKGQIFIEAAQKLGIACLKYCDEVYLRQRQQAVRAVVANIKEVIKACSHFFDFENKDHITRTFYELSTAVILPLRNCTVEEADEEASEWDNSDGDYDSEAVDRIGPHDEDMHL
ncbi:uncharacterized protein L3040_000736 [Drepanopeziza brunnea f. sp. 'multigermtubi']|uniref:Ubiquitin carboxyl-terminal hydrolase n=1 Tax=Marssonina brunnea f. sp. multigermtubi (strain MB_m1) TaxID=1072389 RepID=K1X838_MARBU|nr:ubiquitin carboxyl-terminal hydrolase [Drepanopeziza brunnea f. sp. 'multigermtubi' MB_m1]EKD21222.1 ubiquitin carboxyl-terminal hydrolase [Drepanopeziza brunnea f. sp. 'multigermtubi' MB_m1]KAJ5054462.1 hypothetical protein L3040_000736 [Drepanopeziza brunnea f. sp. 'multigermtubi']